VVLDNPALDDRALRGRAAHVERDEPIGPEDPREARAAGDAGRRARLDRVHRLRARRLERERTAVGLGHQELSGEATSPEPAAELAQVAVHDRLNVRVHDRRAGPLVLAPLLRDPVRGRDRHAGYLVGDDAGGALLVARVAIREQEHDRHRLDAVGAQPAGGRTHGLLVERDQHVARGRQPLGHLVHAAARHQGLGPPVKHVVHLQEVAAADLEHVAEPVSREEPGPRALELEERVDPDRGAVDDEATIGQPHAGLVDAGEDAVEQLARSGEGLGGDDGARGLVERHEIRERAADIDTDSQSHVIPLFIVVGHGRAHGRSPRREGHGHPRGRSDAPQCLYCSGEKADGRRILFSCVMSRSAPPGGGHTPFFRASSRTCIR
jgi:hypothetical protein